MYELAVQSSRYHCSRDMLDIHSLLQQWQVFTMRHKTTETCSNCKTCMQDLVLYNRMYV